MRILLPSAKENSRSIEGLVDNLRAYEQTSVVTRGSRMLWGLSRSIRHEE